MTHAVFPNYTWQRFKADRGGECERSVVTVGRERPRAWGEVWAYKGHRPPSEQWLPLIVHHKLTYVSSPALPHFHSTLAEGPQMSNGLRYL